MDRTSRASAPSGGSTSARSADDRASAATAVTFCTRPRTPAAGTFGRLASISRVSVAVSEADSTSGMIANPSRWSWSRITSPDTLEQQHDCVGPRPAILGDLLILGRVIELMEGSFVGKRQQDDLVAVPRTLDAGRTIIRREQTSAKLPEHSHESGLIPIVRLPVLHRELGDGI